MQTALIFLTCSVLTLAFVAGVFRIEDARGGKMVILASFRRLFNRCICCLGQKLSAVDTYFGRGFARLLFHYAVHGVLNRFLAWIEKTEKKVEYLLRRNKQVAMDIRKSKTKTHLDKIADYQEETALTEAQKTKMRSHE